MDSILQKFDAEIKEALKSRNELKLSVVRMIKASLKNKAIEKEGKPLTDDDAIAVLSSLAKQRREAIAQYESANRQDLADKEAKELEIILSYLPKQLSPEELDAIIKEAIAEVSAKTQADIGKVMKVLMPKIKGSVDGKLVNQRVKELLS